jgi:hypothetical protein
MANNDDYEDEEDDLFDSDLFYDLAGRIDEGDEALEAWITGTGIDEVIADIGPL